MPALRAVSRALRIFAYRTAALIRLIYFDAFVGQREGLVQIGRGVTYTGTVQIRLGARVFLGCNGIFQGSGRVAVGARTYIGNFFVFNCRSNITIGDKCLLGNFVTLVDNDHRTRDAVDIMDQGFDAAAIRIERNCWIGEKATILSGVTVHENAVVAAGSVVTRDVPRDAVVAGVPARVLRMRSQAAG